MCVHFSTIPRLTLISAIVVAPIIDLTRIPRGLIFRMTMGVDKLITAITRLPRADRERLLEALRSTDVRAADAVRDAAATYQTKRPGESMTLVTVPLPDDLAEQARNAGLLAGKPLETMLRRALEEHDAAAAVNIAPGQERRLVRNEHGYLVVDALPGEPPITTEEVKKALDDMEW